MIRWFVLCLAAIVLMLLASCRRSKPGGAVVEPYLAVVEPYLTDASSVGFDLTPIQVGTPARQWIGTYAARGKTARFRIEIGPGKESEGMTGGEFHFKFGQGRIVSEAGSDASALLSDLHKALEVTKAPKPVARKPSISFEYVELGEHQSQAPGGGFRPTPSGNWTTMKLFFGEGEQESEVFLNLNCANKKGQFSIKDADYGDLVLEQLASVF